MIPDDKLFEKIHIKHSFHREGRILAITPEVVLDSPESTVLIASSFIDSFEMIESARICIKKGKNSVPFMQSAKIVNPLIWNPHTLGEPALYELKTVFYKNGAAYFLIVQMTGIRECSLKETSGELSLWINGKILPCIYKEIPAEMTIAEIMQSSRKEGYNFTIVKGNDPVNAEKILDLCDRTGIAAALDITGVDKEMLEKYYILHPSICLHTASKGEFSPIQQDFPFLALEEIKNKLLKEPYTGDEK